MKARAALALLLAALAIAVAALAALVGAASQHEPQKPAQALEASDVMVEPFCFSYNDDMQYPELPSGCEPTAVSTLLRMNGIDAGKADVAAAMPKSGWDYVNAFLGDPASDDGWCCMAPCAQAAADAFLSSAMQAVDATGTALADVPVPFCAWASIDMEPLEPAGSELGGYVLYENPHCVTVTEVSAGGVKCIDPLKGLVTYGREQFEGIFDTGGRQSVYIERKQ